MQEGVGAVQYGAACVSGSYFAHIRRWIGAMS